MIHTVRSSVNTWMIPPLVRHKIAPANTAPRTMLSPASMEASAAVKAWIDTLLPKAFTYSKCSLSLSVRSMPSHAPLLSTNSWPMRFWQRECLVSRGLVRLLVRRHIQCRVSRAALLMDLTCRVESHPMNSQARLTQTGRCAHTRHLCASDAGFAPPTVQLWCPMVLVLVFSSISKTQGSLIKRAAYSSKPVAFITLHSRCFCMFSCRTCSVLDIISWIESTTLAAERFWGGRRILHIQLPLLITYCGGGLAEHTC